jgi:hypothetical protein
MPRQLITPGPESFQTKPKAKERWKDMLFKLRVVAFAISEYG